jgi:hypothetical protein
MDDDGAWRNNGAWAAPVASCWLLAADSRGGGGLRFEGRAGGGRGGGVGGVYRQSAYASVPCYLCVAFALTVSKVLT